MIVKKITTFEHALYPASRVGGFIPRSGTHATSASQILQFIWILFAQAPCLVYIIMLLGVELVCTHSSEQSCFRLCGPDHLFHKLKPFGATSSKPRDGVWTHGHASKSSEGRCKICNFANTSPCVTLPWIIHSSFGSLHGDRSLEGQAGNRFNCFV